MSINKKLDTVGRIVLPADYREALNLKRDDSVALSLEGNSIVIRPTKEEIVSKIKSKIKLYKKRLKTFESGSTEEQATSLIVAELEDLLR